MDNLLIVTIALYVGAMVFMFALMFMSGRRKQDAMEHTVEIHPELVDFPRRSATTPDGDITVDDMLLEIEKALEGDALFNGIAESGKYGVYCVVKDNVATIKRKSDRSVVGVYNVKLYVWLKPGPGSQGS